MFNDPLGLVEMQHRLAAGSIATRDGGQRGFALVAVIWSLGLIVLLGTAVIAGAKYRSTVSNADASAAKAAAAAESSINLAIAAILSPQSNLKFPLQCKLPGGERAFITVEEEIGKVDLNTATQAVLERLFVGLTRDKVLGSRIATDIIAVREPKRVPSQEVAASPSSQGDHHATPAFRFTTITELDRIGGISPGLFRSALPFVTVRSGRTEPERQAASPRLAQLLGFDATTARRRDPILPGNLTVRADVGTPDGSRYVREVLISAGESGRPYGIREWRRGYVESDDAARIEALQNGGRTRDCLTIGTRS